MEFNQNQSEADRLLNIESGSQVEFSIPQDDSDVLRLKQIDIADEISQDEIKQALLNSESQVELPNYTLDFTGVEQITQYQMRALEELLLENGQSLEDSIPIYVWQDKDVIKLGYGDLVVTSKILPQIVQKVFAGQCKLYKDVIPGQPLKESCGLDIAALRMQI